MITRKLYETWGAYCARCREAGETPKSMEASYQGSQAAQSYAASTPATPLPSVAAEPASPAPLSAKSRLEVYLAVGLTADERAGLVYLRDQDLRLIGKAIALAGTPDAPDSNEVAYAMGRVAVADDALARAPRRG